MKTKSHREPVPQNKATAKADGGRAFAATGDMTFRDYYEAPPAATPPNDSQDLKHRIGELRHVKFSLGPNEQWFDLAEILLMAADRLTTPTSAMTFQATIQNAISPPDQPTDHKDVPPEILAEFVLHQLLGCERIDPAPGGGAIRAYGTAPYNSYQLTDVGKATVRALRAEQAAQSERHHRTEILGKLYSDGKDLMLLKKDYEFPPSKESLGGFTMSELVYDQFTQWDVSVKQFLREQYGVAEAVLYGGEGYPIQRGETTVFDLLTARLGHLRALLAQVSELN